MTMLYDAKEFSSLSDMVYHHLYEAITDGRYHSGDLLIEMKIAEELGVSRTPVREAIRKLELEGLVLMIPRKGAEVAEITRQDMEDVLEVYENEFSVDWVRCIAQTSGMHEQEKEEFIEEFSTSEGTLVGFCVMGGVFSEGIDLMGEKLIGAVIVGTGLPQIGTQREILRQYYDKKGADGFDYAYRYPGMNKVLQSAGRVIRTQEDTGIILLLDERFADHNYRTLFPAEWSDRRNCTLNTVEQQLGEFWNRVCMDK